MNRQHVRPPIGVLALIVFVLAALPAIAQEGEWSLGSLSREIRELTGAVNPAVVQIYTSSFGPVMGSLPQGAAIFGKQQATGSGVIVDPDGYIITNNHVVAGAKRVQVRLSPAAVGAAPGASIIKTGGAIVGARVVGVDEETDLAVLKINRKDLPYLELGNSDDLYQGQLVFAFGSPMGLTNSVSFGVVSTVARQLERDNSMIYIQTDVAINPGNSGGPLVNTQGEVIGINTLIITQSGGSEGLGFSAPSNIVRTVYDQIRANGRVRRGIIGIHAQTLNPYLSEALGLDTPWGVILGDVYPGGPAARAGLQAGDVVLSLDGKAMENARQLEVDLYGKAIGSEVALEVRRGASTTTRNVEIIERIDPDTRFFDLISSERNLVDRLGLLCLDLDKDAMRLLPHQPRGSQGVIVAALAAETSIFGERFLPGDILYTLNGRQLKDLRDLKKQFGDLVYGDVAVFHLERGGQLRFLILMVD